MFVVRTVASLGEITAVRLWHYNLGSHPKWFVLLHPVLDYFDYALVKVSVVPYSIGNQHTGNLVIDRRSAESNGRLFCAQVLSGNL